MKVFKFLLLSIFFIGLNSCSSSDEGDDTGGSGVASITLTPSTITQMVGEDITFTVKTDSGEDVTLDTALAQGNNPISNATFTTNTAGDYEIKATYQGKTATVTVTFTDVPPSAIILSADVISQATGDNIVFTVKTDTGVNVTSSAVITTGSTTITGGVFNSSVIGSFDVSATYLDFTSEVVTVNFAEPINFTKRVLIEDYTGTWCGFCPRVSYGIELVKEATDKAVVVAIHRGNDPYNFNATALENMINLEGYPTAMLNRKTDWNYPEPNNVNQVVNLTSGTNPKLGLALTSTVAGGNINLEVKTKFGKSLANAKLVVYVLENGLVYDQVNYTQYFGGGSTIPSFVHEHVLRASLTNLLGDAFTAQESVYENEVTRTFNVPVPANVANVANLEFVAFVVGADNKAINVRNAMPGESQTLEQE